MQQDVEGRGGHRPHSWLKDRDHRFLRVNSALGAALHRSPTSLVGRRDSDFFPLEVAVRYRRDDLLVAESGRSVLFFEHAVHSPVPGWITTKTPVRRHGGPAVAGVARPWSTEGIHEALRIPPLIDARSADVPAWLLEAEDRVRGRFRERLVIEDLACEAGLHPGYFGSRFRKVVGVNLHALVRKLRVAWCLERLAEAGLGLSAVAHRAGFADQSHFTRAFTREVGMPPGSFRDGFD